MFGRHDMTYPPPHKKKEYPCYPWISTDHPWIIHGMSMDFYRFLWILHGYPWFFRIMHGYPRMIGISMDIHGLCVEIDVESMDSPGKPWVIQSEGGGRHNFIIFNIFISKMKNGRWGLQCNLWQLKGQSKIILRKISEEHFDIVLLGPESVQETPGTTFTLLPLFTSRMQGWESVC